MKADAHRQRPAPGLHACTRLPEALALKSSSSPTGYEVIFHNQTFVFIVVEMEQSTLSGFGRRSAKLLPPPLGPHKNIPAVGSRDLSEPK
jgi:hypothetical protein